MFLCHCQAVCCVLSVKSSDIVHFCVIKDFVPLQGLLMSSVNDKATRLYTETVNKMHEDMERSVPFDSHTFSFMDSSLHSRRVKLLEKKKRHAWQIQSGFVTQKHFIHSLTHMIGLSGGFEGHQQKSCRNISMSPRGMWSLTW